MEIKAKLNKPFTEEQRINFIVSQNHANGYKIEETETALEAWGLTREEEAERDDTMRKARILSQLEELDFKCIRALRAIAAGTGTEADTARLAELEAQAAELREQI